MRRRFPVVALLASVLACAVSAAELQDRTRQAYEAYREDARRAFLERIQRTPAPVSPRDARPTAGPAREDGIIGVPGGLVHHWVGTAFARDARLDDVIAVSHAYGDYPRIYRTVLMARVLERDGDTARVMMRLRESEAGVTAVLDVRSTVQYFFPTSGSAYALSNADEIREVKNPGARDERLLPAGRDSGYLWRASTFTWFVEQDGGVRIEMETIGLSRGFPPLLGWFIEPIARGVGRRSVRTSLEEFLAALATVDSPAGPE